MKAREGSTGPSRVSFKQPLGVFRPVLPLIRQLGLALALLANGGAWAHDPSSYGGLFRSRNLGETWLNADVGLFLNAALAVAVSPRDPLHLLMGTDLGLVGSRNGGRSWDVEARDLIFGPVFAVTFSPDGERAVCAAQSGVFRHDGGRWTAARVPDAAIPARTVAYGSAPDRIYLLGRSRLFRSSDGGETYAAVPGPAEESAFTALDVRRGAREILVAAIDGAVRSSEDGGGQWRAGSLGSAEDPVDTVAVDPWHENRLWAARGGRVYVSDDIGSSWRAAGSELPEPGTTVRGIAASRDGIALLLTTHRGTLRSEDGGQSWALKEGNLPVHIEAGPLARDPGDPGVIYAVYSLVPYSEVWRAASEGGNLLARLDWFSLAGGASFCLLVLIGGAVAVRWLMRLRRTGSALGGSAR